MKRLRIAAQQVGLGLAAVYLFFLIPDIEGLFKPSFLILMRQFLSIGFAICIFINPKALMEAGAKFGPRAIEVLTLIFGSKNKKDGTLD